MQILIHAGQQYAVLGSRVYTTKTGKEIVIAVLRTPCWECGEMFETTIPYSNGTNTAHGQLSRRCIDHARKGFRVTEEGRFKGEIDHDKLTAPPPEGSVDLSLPEVRIDRLAVPERVRKPRPPKPPKPPKLPVDPLAPNKPHRSNKPYHELPVPEVFWYRGQQYAVLGQRTHYTRAGTVWIEALVRTPCHECGAMVLTTATSKFDEDGNHLISSPKARRCPEHAKPGRGIPKKRKPEGEVDLVALLAPAPRDMV